MKKQITKKQFAIAAVLGAVLILLAVLLGTLAARQLRLRKILRSSEYNCVFLSMFPIDTFQEEDFAYYRADTVLKLTYVIPNYAVLKQCLKEVRASENEVTVLYLGIDPKKVNASQILELQSLFPGVQFEIIPACRPLTQWLADRHLDDTFDAYRRLTEQLVSREKIRVYSFFAQEWLIADNANYASDMLFNENVAHRLYLYADAAHNCNFTPENVAPLFGEFQNLLADARVNGYAFPDLSQWEIVFLGDSVIGNYSDHHSIPELVAAFSGARTYNLGWGGSKAGGEDLSSGLSVLNAFLEKDLAAMPPETQTYAGIKKYLEESPSKNGRTLFVLHYGLNEYFQGIPLDGKDRLDANTYCGSLRLLIETLQSARPDASILLIAPNAVISYQNGTMNLSEEGAPLASYVDAVQRMAEEYGLPLQDDYHNVIRPDDARRFLDGEVHPNEYGRYLIAKALVRTISRSFPPAD